LVRREIIKHNYLNNKDLLKEIHLSKNSYCTFLDSERDHQFDIILSSIDEITSETIEMARQNRIARFIKESSDKTYSPVVNDEDLVFRINTWEHIPLAPPKLTKEQKKKKKIGIHEFFSEVDTDEEDNNEVDDISEIIVPDKKDFNKLDHLRINFPPFVHYRLKDGFPYVVGKSHWKVDSNWNGDFQDGEFCQIHGSITDNLARMLMKLTEKYALKGNWRNYSYREEMEGQSVLQLIQSALLFDEAKSQNPFAFFTQISYHSFVKIVNTEKKNQNLRDDLLIHNGLTPSSTRVAQDSYHYE